MTLSLSAACEFNTDGIPLDRDAYPIDSISVPDAMLLPDAPPPDAPPDAPEGCSDECVDNDAAYCNADGTVENCPLGCSAMGGAHCQVIVASNGASEMHLAGVTGDLSVQGTTTVLIDTNDGSIEIDGVGGSVIREPGEGGVDGGMGFHYLSPSLSVLAVNSLLVASGATVRIRGDRALIILSAGDVSIGGLIDIGGGCLGVSAYCPGPGGGRGATGVGAAEGCAPGGDGQSMSSQTGGGGGGLGAAGASGGNGASGPSGGTGGIPSTESCPDETLVPLVGGSGGGKGRSQAGIGGRGGSGGGALQITSKTRIIFAEGGGIWAGGTGGAPGVGLNDDGGGGGGSGGAILLEAPEIMAAGAILTANGGGGGGGRVGALAGEMGTHTTAQAAGGAGGANGGDDYRGGAGGSFDGVAQAGAGGGDGTGGGGGGVGIIRINAPDCVLNIPNAVISPAHTCGVPDAE